MFYALLFYRPRPKVTACVISNIMRVKSGKDNSVQNYSYLADGVRFFSLDAEKMGFIYLVFCYENDGRIEPSVRKRRF